MKDEDTGFWDITDFRNTCKEVQEFYDELDEIDKYLFNNVQFIHEYAYENIH